MMKIRVAKTAAVYNIGKWSGWFQWVITSDKREREEGQIIQGNVSTGGRWYDWLVGGSIVIKM